MYFIIYQITNQVNGKIYIGSHKTDNLEDGYMGSGTILNRAVKKHGEDKFVKEILHCCATADEMYNKERELVNEAFIRRKDIYNIKLGGKGGFDYINSAGLADYSANGRVGGKVHATKIKEDPDYRKAWRERSTRMNYIKHERGLMDHCYFGNCNWHQTALDLAKSPAAIAKRKRSYKKIKHQQGTKNSQFGTMWITDGVSNKKIQKTAAIPNGWRKGRTI